jgi:FKBP-type peptidyl-prolyl cis-trans isomerase FklB
MKTTIWTVIICLGAAAPLFADGTNVLNDDKARTSYAIGMSVGQSLQDVHNQGIEVDTDLVARGIKDMLSGGTTLLTSEQMQATVMAFKKDLAARTLQKRAELAAKNKAAGEAFLATNKNNPGVVTLPDGLQYKVITNGTGDIPTPADTVTVNYRGTLVDGTEFDSSFKGGQPAQFAVNRLLPGWAEAVLKMNSGSRWQLFIPAELAFGEMAGRGVPPNSVVIIDVDLLSTKSPPPPAPPAPPAAAAPLTSDIIKVPSAEELKKGAKIEIIKPEDAKKMQ